MTRTREEIEIIVNDLGYVLLDEYKDKVSHRRVIIKDMDGYKYDIDLSSLLSSRNIQPMFVATDNPYSLYNISIWLIKKEKRFELFGKNEYTHSKIKLNLRCLDCNNNFEMRWNNVYIDQGCPFCVGKIVSDKNRLVILFPNLIEEFSNKNNCDINKLSYGSNKKVIWKCKKCNYEWVSSVRNRKDGYNCPACAGKIVTDKNRLSIINPVVASEWHPIKNKDLTPFDVSFGSNKKVWWLCNKNNHIWISTIDSRTGIDGSGCPKCNESKGEKEISRVLLINDIEFIPQYRFKNCRYKLPLPFDFYLSDYKILIEYDGELHNGVGRWKNKEKAQRKLEETQRNDKIKTKYCLDNNISLLRINYKDFKNIEQILIDYLNL